MAFKPVQVSDLYQNILVQYVEPHVVEVRLNRPAKRNAINTRAWHEIGHAFSELLPREEKCRCILLTGSGKIFSAGIDLASGLGGGDGGGPLTSIGQQNTDGAAKGLRTFREGGAWQRAWKAINTCNKPVVAAIQKGCYGAALEMICFADVRYCTADCIFSAPEVDLGLAADIGGNQIFPKIIGNDSFIREVQLTGRKFTAQEAFQHGLVSKLCPDGTALRNDAMKVAVAISTKSPTATLGIKKMLNFTRDHTIDDSLEYALTWNSMALQSNDMMEAGRAFISKRPPTFSNIESLLEAKKILGKL
jgi:Delta3,5-Delta2,4-dienoyl-CoA isomerase